MSMVSDDSTSRVMVLPVSCPHACDSAQTEAFLAICVRTGYEHRNRCTRSATAHDRHWTSTEKITEPRSMSATSILPRQVLTDPEGEGTGTTRARRASAQRQAYHTTRDDAPS